jgi:Ca2+:H+ antiporter
MLGRVAVLLLVVVTVLAGITAEWLVSSIEGLVETGNVSEQFVALILLPLVGNASEHVAVSCSLDPLALDCVLR